MSCVDYQSEDALFYTAVYHIILAQRKGHSTKHLRAARAAIRGIRARSVERVFPVISENYARVYDDFAVACMTNELEEVINYLTLSWATSSGPAHARCAAAEDIARLETVWRLRFEQLPARPNVLHGVLCVRSIVVDPAMLLPQWVRLLSVAIEKHHLELADSTIGFLRRAGVDSPEVRSLEIAVQWERGSREEAIAALLMQPSTAAGELTLGDWLAELGRFSDARAHLHEASQLSQSVKVWRLWSFVSLKLFETGGEMEHSFLVDALEGALSGLVLSIGDSLSFSVRILSILFRRPSLKVIFESFRARLHDIPVHVWIGVMPQIIARANTEDGDLRDLIQTLILAVGREHPHVVLYSLMVPIKGEMNERQRCHSL
jgi:FKBP12-rapamycin complex-associated protein